MERNNKSLILFAKQPMENRVKKDNSYGFEFHNDDAVVRIMYPLLRSVPRVLDGPAKREKLFLRCAKERRLW